MKIAYADPPYIGQAKKHYSSDDKCGEVDHYHLINCVLSKYDRWALSLSSPSLYEILPMCPISVRVMPWVKPWASFKPGVNIAYAWEPVIFFSPNDGDRGYTIRDYCSCSASTGRGVPGAKPSGFCFWLFEVLGVREDDEFIDLFPGSGGVTQFLSSYLRQRKLFGKKEEP